MATVSVDEKPSEFALTAPEPRQLTPMDLLSVALSKDAAIDVIERLAKLQMDMRKMDAEIDFNESMTRCQEDIKRIAPDMTGANQKKYASFKAIDKEVRPVYTRLGFALSWDTAECSIPDHVLVICYVSKGLYTRRYQIPIDASGKGAKGGDVMDKPKAMGAALSYGQRYLVRAIFNISIGEEDGPTNGELVKAVEKILDAGEPEMLKHYYFEAFSAFQDNPDAVKAIQAAKLKRQKELGKK